MRPFLPAVAVALLAPLAPLAQEATPVELEVGGKVALCREGLAVCPVSVVLCDDPRIALIEGGSEGPVLRGLSPGTTLCSAAGPGGAFRRVFRVTVSAKPPDGASGEGGKGRSDRG